MWRGEVRKKIGAKSQWNFFKVDPGKKSKNVKKILFSVFDCFEKLKPYLGDFPILL